MELNICDESRVAQARGQWAIFWHFVVLGLGNMVAFLPFLVTRDRRAHDFSFFVLAVRCLVHTAQSYIHTGNPHTTVKGATSYCCSKVLLCHTLPPCEKSKRAETWPNLTWLAKPNLNWHTRPNLMYNSKKRHKLLLLESAVVSYTCEKYKRAETWPNLTWHAKPNFTCQT